MVVRIEIIWVQTCPVCRFIIKEIISKLQMWFYDEFVIDYRESVIKDLVGKAMITFGGAYQTAYGRTPEIYVGDRAYVFYVGSFSGIYKFYKDLIKVLNIQERLEKYTIYRRRFLEKKLKELEKKLKTYAEREKELMD